MKLFRNFFKKQSTVNDKPPVSRIDNRVNLFEINSTTGRIELNGCDLPRLNGVDIHIDNRDNARILLDMDASVERATLLIEGHVRWFEGIDREKILRGQQH